MRHDAWWVQPLFTFLGLSTFIVYSTWRAFHGQHFLAVDGGTNYLSPFFSPIVYFHDLPTLSADLKSALAAHAWLGTMPGWVPHWVSPAFFILWAPAGFRFTCYYYRGAYYKAFWADPINCSVSEPRNSYRGEHKFPLIFQNIHRYFFYVAAAFIFILSYDAWQGMWFAAEDGVRKFGQEVWPRHRQLCVVGQCYLSGRLHLRMSFISTPNWRRHQQTFQGASELKVLRVCRMSQCQTHDLGVVQFGLGRVYGFLRLDVCQWYLDRFSDFINGRFSNTRA